MTENLQQIAASQLHRLTKREQEVMKYMYGIDTQPHSADDTCIHFRIERQRLKQIRFKCLRHMIPRANNIRQYLD